MIENQAPSIVIVMGDGQMQEVLGNGIPVNIVVVEYAPDDVPPEDLVECPAFEDEGTELAYLTKIPVDDNPQKVADIFAAFYGARRYDVQIYCDGSADPNRGHAGSGIAICRDGSLAELLYGLFHDNGTNNTAELHALRQALLIAEREIAAGKSVQVLSDSKYAIDVIGVHAERWKQCGWRRPKGAIKNLALIQETHALYDRIKSNLELAHVAGHAGTVGNELADQLASLAVRTRQAELRSLISTS